jgi:hypothetical protein
LEKRENAQFMWFSNKRAHLLRKIYLIWREEEVLEAKTYWDMIVGPPPLLAHFGELLFGILFFGSLAQVLVKEGALQK